MGTKRRKQELHPALRVVGGGPEKSVVTVGAGIALALDRAHRGAVGTVVLVTEWGETLGRAVRYDTYAAWETA